MNASQGASARPSWLRSNQGTGALLTAVFSAGLAYYLNQDWVFERLRDGFLLGLLTLTGLVGMLVSSLWLLVDECRREVTAELRDVGLIHLLAAVVASLVTLLLFWGGLEIGFPLAMAIFAALAMFALGLRPASSCLWAGIAVSAAVFLIFLAIGRTLPLGFLAGTFA